MLGSDPEFGAFVLRLWLAAGSTILLALFCVLAIFQPQLRMTSSPLRRAGFVVAGAALGAVITWAFVDRGAAGERAAERRAFEAQAERLNALALAPGSPLACLNALAGEIVETACEKTLFVAPAGVAAASSYVATQLTLLSSLVGYRRDGGTGVDNLVATLRRPLEADRFGFVAHVLAVRDACTGESCETLALFQDSSRVRATLAAGGISRYLDHYAALWGTPAEAVVAEGAASGQSAPSRKLVNADFPSAASIPPVSIMNPEPAGPVLPGVAAAAAANPNAPASGASASRHARKTTATAGATISGQFNPSGLPGVEPIWPEPVPAPPPTQTTQPAPAPVAAAPIQLNPPNAGAATRTQ
jgi:hypothetical protein